MELFSVRFTDQRRCRLQLCDDAGPADAVCVATLHLLREGNAGHNTDAVCYMRQCFTSFAREMPTKRRCCLLHATMLHLLSEGNAGHNTDAVRFCRQCFTSLAREMPVYTDAVRFCRQCFTSFMREMPINRRCRSIRCGLYGHAIYHAVFVTTLFVDVGS